MALRSREPFRRPSYFCVLASGLEVCTVHLMNNSPYALRTQPPHLRSFLLECCIAAALSDNLANWPGRCSGAFSARIPRLAYVALLL